MTISRTNRVPRGYEVQKDRYHYLSDGIAPALDLSAATFLPVVEEDKRHDLWFVVLAGQFVAKDQTSLNSGSYDNTQMLVPANGLVAQTVTYTSDDVGLTLDIDQLNSGTEATVTAAGAATKTIAANYPAGMAPFKYYSKAFEKVYFNNFPQPNHVFITSGLVEVPLIFHGSDGATATDRASADPGTEQDTLDDGRLVMSGTGGYPVLWTSDSSVEQICGRCIEVVTISTTEDALDKVHTVPGLSLPGTGTGGRAFFEDFYLNGSSSTKVVRKARINLLLT